MSAVGCLEWLRRVKMNTEEREVTPLDVGNALEEVWQDKMASWTNYDDDNHAEYLVDAPPRLTHVLKEEYWTTVFSKISDLDTLRALLNPACTKEYLLLQKRKSCTVQGKLSAFQKPYEIRFKQLFEKRLLLGGMKPFNIFRDARVALGHTDIDIAYEYSCYRRNFLQDYYQRLGLLTFEQFCEKAVVPKSRRMNFSLMRHDYKIYRMNWEELRMRGEAVDNDSLCGIKKPKDEPAEAVFDFEGSPRPRDLCEDVAKKSSEPKRKKKREVKSKPDSSVEDFKIMESVAKKKIKKRVHFAEEDSPVKGKKRVKFQRKPKIEPEEEEVSPVKTKRRVKLEKPKIKPRKKLHSRPFPDLKDPWFTAM